MTGVGSSPRGLEDVLRRQQKDIRAQENRRSPSWGAMQRAIENFGATGPGYNLLSNPSFERGVDDWDQTGTDSSEADSTKFRLGQTSLTSTGAMRRVSQPFAVLPGQVIRVSGYAAMVGSASPLNVGLVPLGGGASDWLVYSNMESIPADGSWNYFSMDYRVPDGTTILQVRIGAVAQADSQIWLDDLSARVTDGTGALELDGRLSPGGLRNESSSVTVGSRLGAFIADTRGALENGWYWGSGSTADSPTSYPFLMEVRSLGGSTPYVEQVATRASTATEVASAKWRRESRDGGATWSGWVLSQISTSPFTPEITNGITLGNGSISGEYTVSDGFLHGAIRVGFGSTTQLTGEVTFALPRPFQGSRFYYGSGRAMIGGTIYQLLSLIANDRVYARVNSSSGSYVTQLGLTSGRPAAWSSGSSIEINFGYPCK